VKKDGKRVYKDDLTYENLVKLLNLKDYGKTEGIPCSIKDALPFFERFKLGLFVYDVYQKLIFKYEPEDKEKNKNYKILQLITKDDHMYEVNEKGKSLTHTVERDEEDLEEMFVSDNYNLNRRPLEDFKIHMIDNLEDITKYIKQYATEIKEEEPVF
jgi:hypothetical protein